MSKPANKWVAFDPKSVGAETPIRVRKGKRAEDASATVVISQHGQLLEGSDRKLIEWMPEEMNLAVSDEPAAPEAPAL